MFNSPDFLILIFAAILFALVYEVNSAKAQSMTETEKLELLEKFNERDEIRVRVSYNMDHLPRRFLGPAYQNQIAELHEQLIREMTFYDLDFNIVSKENTRPEILITIDEDTMQYLFDSKIVEDVRFRGHIGAYRCHCAIRN